MSIMFFHIFCLRFKDGAEEKREMTDDGQSHVLPHNDAHCSAQCLLNGPHLIVVRHRVSWR